MSSSRFEGDLYALVQAYVDQRTRDAIRHYDPPRSQAYALDDARKSLRRQLPTLKAWTALTAVAPMAGRLADRCPSGLLGGIGMAVFATGLASLALLPADPSSLDIAWRMLMAGAGFGLFQSPNNRTMLSAAPPERAGGASGMLGTARLTGQTLGAALVALIFNL